MFHDLLMPSFTFEPIYIICFSLFVYLRVNFFFFLHFISLDMAYITWSLFNQIQHFPSASYPVIGFK